MSRPAPIFSANEIGARFSGGWIERSALDVTNVGRAANLFWDDTEVIPPESPKKDFFNARRANAATSTMPAPVNQTAIGKAFHAPIRIVISAANPLNPGMPMEAAEAMTKENAAKGSARLNPMVDSVSSSRVWVRR